MMKSWWVYVLECGDGSLYTGISVSVEDRVRVHNQGKGAKYTRARLPVKLMYKQELETRSLALKREVEIKKMTRVEKLKLIS